ncbi:P1 family peptidase [Clostridium folliculivorans]|uniref:Peptidase n=1 Tax=Clostridium folliculivorans TaxID=2886038 RepID=A0A9W6DAS2_9CLOT|nr:P1 family peptidase [Clostridium folliculivorans]GKU25665.1 peptidase [Clostridium folliculivorans]GKU28687.1 peptidase [Clostridium folliculivorans]
MNEIKFCDIEGIRVGHSENLEAGTGCTVVICEEGASGGVEVRGGAPGTRETDLLNPTEMVEKIHAVVLSGGSAFGLDAATGVMEYLENNDIGFDVSVTKVPIVCQAVLFDLVCGNGKIRPDKKMGFDACINSESLKEDLKGNIGAGTGATVGKILGPKFSMKGGLGTYAVQIGGLQIGAIVAVNCLGDVIDPSTNEIIAGALDESFENFVNTEEVMISQYFKKNNVFNGNTTIGIIATNAILTKAEANKVASMAHNGFGRTMRPAHTMVDGDTIFTMATGKVSSDINVVGLLSARVMEKAIINAIKSAESSYGFKSYKDKIKL